MSVVIGLVTLGLAFAGGASAQHPAAQVSTACAANSWTATVTVSNSPRVSNGVATISGSGTALDGSQLAAGGGQQSVTLTEPLGVQSVSVAGRLTWPKGYTAPFHAVATKPSSCAANASSLQSASANSVHETGARRSSDETSTDSRSSSTSATSDTVAGAAAAMLPAAKPAADPKVTLCHATNSNSNPYVQVTVAAAGAFNGHLGHTGPIWNPTLKANGTRWGDIIPPFTFRGGTYSLNWPAGEAIFNAGCSVAPPVTTTATVTSAGPTVTITVGQTATVTVAGPTVTVGGAPQTVTETVSGSAATVTVSNTVTDTVTVVNCPPGAGLEAAGGGLGGAAAEGSLAFTGSGGDNALMSLVGGALTAGGMVCLIMARRRGGARAH